MPLLHYFGPHRAAGRRYLLRLFGLLPLLHIVFWECSHAIVSMLSRQARDAARAQARAEARAGAKAAAQEKAKAEAKVGAEALTLTPTQTQTLALVLILILTQL